ncbi:MAG TPA: selenide, water dikinase SelD [Candidatus Acidoferrales bacterium]
MNTTNKVRLTETVKAGGCASKLSPAALDSVLSSLTRQHDPKVLVGFETADDAGVYQISPELALVQTVDFFTPIVDDPFTFGQIAAVNALSDVYAMGGRPLTSLAMVCFPEKADIEILGQVLAGGLSKMVEAGCTVVGGHSIRDQEMKFGYAVTGSVHPQHILKNGGARVGDLLVFTKALGTGVISTALKAGKAQEAWIAAATKSMTTLNKLAAEVAAEFGADVHGATDVTGFGLIGHSREIVLAGKVSMRIDAAKIPVLSGAFECIRAGFIPGGLKSNRDFAECLVEYGPGVDDDVKALLFDPQTAGGLLLSIAPESAERYVKKLQSLGGMAAIVGEILPHAKPLIRVV